MREQVQPIERNHCLSSAFWLTTQTWIVRIISNNSIIGHDIKNQRFLFLLLFLKQIELTVLHAFFFFWYFNMFVYVCFCFSFCKEWNVFRYNVHNEKWMPPNDNDDWWRLNAACSNNNSAMIHAKFVMQCDQLIDRLIQKWAMRIY